MFWPTAPSLFSLLGWINIIKHSQRSLKNSSTCFLIFFFTVAFIYLEPLQNCERQHLHGHSRKKKTPCGTHRSGSPKVTEIQHLKLLCWLRENNICRLSVWPIIPPHTHACVSDKKKKKKERERERKRSCNCSNVCERTRSLDPIWHPSQHVFLSRALGSNVNKRKRLWVLHTGGKRENGHIAESIPNVWLAPLRRV